MWFMCLHGGVPMFCPCFFSTSCAHFCGVSRKFGHTHQYILLVPTSKVFVCLLVIQTSDFADVHIHLQLVCTIHIGLDLQFAISRHQPKMGIRATGTSHSSRLCGTSRGQRSEADDSWAAKTQLSNLSPDHFYPHSAIVVEVVIIALLLASCWSCCYSSCSYRNKLPMF